MLPLALLLTFLPTVRGSEIAALAQSPTKLPEETGKPARESGGPVLTVVPGEGIVSTQPGTAKCSLGEIDPWQETKVERVFTLRNDTRETLTLDRIQPSCGCTSVVVGGEGDGAGRPLQPGSTVPVKVTLDMNRLRPGPVDKYVWAYLRGRREPAATLELSGTLKRLIGASPDHVSFGRMMARAIQPVTVTLEIDPRLSPSGFLPELVSSNPDIRVVAGTPVSAMAGKKRTQDYTISVSPQAKIGMLLSTLVFKIPTPEEQKAAGVPALSEPARQAFTSLAIPLTGEVIGKVTATPGSVVFGAVQEGTSATRRITLSAVAPGLLKGLTVSVSSPHVRCVILPADAPVSASGGQSSPSVPTLPGSVTRPGNSASPPAAERQILEVTLSGDAPAGSLRAEIALKTSEGEQLTALVFAFIRKKTP